MVCFPQPSLSFLMGLFAAGAVLHLGAASATAADSETRDFAVRIDGRPAGDYHLTIARQDDGSVAITGQTDVRITFYLVRTYTYSYRGTELWKGGRLAHLDSSSEDDGKKFIVNATAADGGTLRLRVNGQERIARGEVWVTTYWCLPPAAQRNRALAILDVDTGREFNGTLQYVGPGQIELDGKALDVAHWRVIGDRPVELFYDSSERLVREEFVEEGHRTVLELQNIRK